jgi:LmbE family N-acetylglucosaminyl deacetylase
MNVLIIAPHPDDETLGCGGTILKHSANGDKVTWLIVSSAKGVRRFAAAQVQQRRQINRVGERLGFHAVRSLDLPTTKLSQYSETRMIDAISGVMDSSKPDVVYIPHDGDAHSDHRAVAHASAACLKSFRRPSVKRILSYETPSETDQALLSGLPTFSPNVFIDISEHLEGKIEALKLYESELQRFPFPRSEENVRAWAKSRGAQAGFEAAEAFCLLRERA